MSTLKNSGGLINGKYRLEIVSRNGTIRRPFGDDFIQNMVLDSGLKYFSGHMPYRSYTSGGTISSFFWNVPGFWDASYKGGSRAELGAGDAPPNKTNTTLNSPLSPAKISSKVGTGYTCFIDKSLYASTGVVTGGIQHEFGEESSSVTYKEAGIWVNHPNANARSACYPCLFSRFVFPSPLIVNKYEFVRLEYQIKIEIIGSSSPILISGSPFDSNPLMDVSGSLRLVGTADKIFGNVSAGGTWTTGGSINCALSYFPISAIGWFSYQVSTVTLLTSGFTIPSCGSSLSATKAQYTSGVANIGRTSAVNYFTESSEESSNRVFGIGDTYRFAVGNPSDSVSIGGMLIVPHIFDGNNCTDLTNGWLWSFNNNQIALSDKAMEFGIIQRVGVSLDA